MNERQRADQLARAIDELINGTPRPGPTPFADQELQSLLHVAQTRLEPSKNAASASADHEAAVWQQLIARLEGRPQPSEANLGHHIATDAAMRQTVAVRRHRRGIGRDAADADALLPNRRCRHRQLARSCPQPSHAARGQRIRRRAIPAQTARAGAVTPRVSGALISRWPNPTRARAGRRSQQQPPSC